MLDGASTMILDAGKGVRTNGRETVIRRRYQTGCLFIRGKRRKVWVARWREDVIAPDGTLKRTMRSGVLGLVKDLPGRREAQNLLDSRLRPINQGRQTPQSTLNFSQFVKEKWEPAILPTFKAGSARYYSAQLRRHLLPAFGSKRLCDMTRVDVQRFFSEKRTHGLSGSSVHGMRTTLSKVLQAAVDWNLLEQDPARGIRLGDRTPKTERLYLTPAEVQRLLTSLPEPCRTIVVVAVLTGLRIGEILALRWKNLDLLRGSVLVRETVSEGLFGTPKTRSSRRDVPMSQPVCEALAAQRGRCRQTGPEDLVFATRKQTPLNPKNLIRRELRPACIGLKLPLIAWHSFRHTHATLLGEVGESLRTAQAILGHSDLKTTLNVYTRAIPESQRRAVDKVAEVLFPNLTRE
jgi:integrase